jgi:hypothetical protein
VVRVGPAEIEQHRDGLTFWTMVALLNRLGLFDRTGTGTDGYATTSQLEDLTELESTPSFLWMVTEERPSDSGQRGRAYARVQLAAAAWRVDDAQQALQEYPEQAGPRRHPAPSDAPQPARRCRCGHAWVTRRRSTCTALWLRRNRAP